MNLDDIDPKVFDEMVTDYLNGIFESQYDDREDVKIYNTNKYNEKEVPF